MRYLLLTLLVGWSWIFTAQSPFRNVQLLPYENASQGFSQCEPSIAIDPNNPNRMAAGSVLDGYYYSSNGGKKWKSKKLSSPYGVWGDPVLAFDGKGSVYYFHLANYPKTVWLDRIVCQRADKLKGKFTEGSYPSPNGKKAQDKHWVVVDPKTNVIYLTWTQFDKYDSSAPGDSSRILFSKSTDRGMSWTEPKVISYYLGDCLDGDNTVEGAVPALGPNGEVYVCWSGPKGLVFQVSKDAGDTWLPVERKIMDHPGGWEFNIPGFYRANGLPILTSDRSNGPNNGTLYLNWCDQSNGTDNTDVWLSKSIDGGMNWTDPIKVNQDKGVAHQFFTWMCVDQSSGYLYFVYYDRRNYSENQTDVFLSYSMDGGNTFKDIKISQEAFQPDKNVFFGDYLGIAAVNGEIRPIWPRMDNGMASLWVALIQQKTLFKLTE